MGRLTLTSPSSSVESAEESSTAPVSVEMPRLGRLRPTLIPKHSIPSRLGRLTGPKKTFRVLDFDIENRPLSYWYDGETTAEITAIAAGFCDESEIHCWLLGVNTPTKMLRDFVAMYDEADMVTGHYIRKHDLPIINGALLEHGLWPLKPKLTSDTKLDLVKRAGISVSQENLADMLDIEAPKVQMNQRKWRHANRLKRDGIELTRERAIGDVLQHQQMRVALIERGLLGPPRVWRP
jgi:hypothetical protein